MLKVIPRSLIDKAAKETGVDVKARTYSVLSHLSTMIFVQLAHALSLDDVCDSLRLKARAIAAFGLTAPSRNNLSNSNKVRDAKFAELVFWRTPAHLQHCDRSFGRRPPGGSSGRSLLLKLGDFLGLSANAIRWQAWTALLWCMCCCVLQRTSASGGHSFTRLFAVVRAAMWGAT